jgi:nickel-dependent lactate racemase
MLTDRAVALAYGRTNLTVTFPDDAELTVIRKPDRPKLRDPEAAVRAALAAPIGGPTLGTIARGRSSACILVCDITRPVPNRLFLRPLVEEHRAAGVALDRITILVATGLHRAGDAAELAEIVGDPWIVERVRVLNHDARNDADHVDLGFTAKRGTPIRIDRRFIEADVRIATGLVEPHFMAGYSGGRKVVAPGVAHAETIRTFHSARFMEDPLATSCNLAGNPLHEEQLEMMQRIGELYAFNTVIDEDRDLVYASFGEIIASHAAAVRYVEAWAAVKLPHRFHTVVTSAAGYPLDKTYYQTVKGMVVPVDIVAPGGTLIVASECSEGFGSPEFRESQRRLVESGPEVFLEQISAKKLADIDEWQTEMQLKAMRVGSVKLYTTGLDDEERRLTGVDVIGSVEAAVRASIDRRGARGVAIIPEGPYVVPTSA